MNRIITPSLLLLLCSCLFAPSAFGQSTEEKAKKPNASLLDGFASYWVPEKILETEFIMGPDESLSYQAKRYTRADRKGEITLSLMPYRSEKERAAQIEVMIDLYKDNPGLQEPVEVNGYTYHNWFSGSNGGCVMFAKEYYLGVAFNCKDSEEECHQEYLAIMHSVIIKE